MANDKYLENWTTGALYGCPVDRLQIDDNFNIILQHVSSKPNTYQVKLKDGRSVVTKFTLNNMPDKDTAKLNAIRRTSDFLHKAAIKFSYGSTNLRVLTGVSMVE